MDIKQLEIFLKLSELCNFTKTANELHYVQSHVSFQIQKLEDELGVPLFNRIGHTITLTAKGRELVPYAQNILQLTKSAYDVIGNTTKSKLILAADESLCIYRLPVLLKRFHTLYPEMEIQVKMIDTLDYEEVVNHCDLAFVLNNNISSPSIRIHHSRQEDLGLFASPSLPITKKESISLTDLSSYQFILTRPECCYRKQFQVFLGDSSIHTLIETSSLQAIKEMTLCGLGICFLPMMAVEKELNSNSLVQLNFSIPFHIGSHIISHKDKHMLNEMSKLISLY